METLKSLFTSSSELEWGDWHALMMGTTALDGFDLTKTALFRPADYTSEPEPNESMSSNSLSSSDGANSLSASGAQTALS